MDKILLPSQIYRRLGDDQIILGELKQIEYNWNELMSDIDEHRLLIDYLQTRYPSMIDQFKQYKEHMYDCYKNNNCPYCLENNDKCKCIENE